MYKYVEMFDREIGKVRVDGNHPLVVCVIDNKPYFIEDIMKVADTIEELNERNK